MACDKHGWSYAEACPTCRGPWDRIENFIKPQLREMFGLEYHKLEERAYHFDGGYGGWIGRFGYGGDSDICLDGNFTADQLEALAWWLRNVNRWREDSSWDKRNSFTSTLGTTVPLPTW